ncbi:IPT/TIG domain-containing protein [Fodinibius sp. AD559]|uniref:IPT/TIG domain-containing protein n=1 Tax=Fodinibius sp. AD559 TaxID=3424179 RepID=UPI004046B755
MFRQTFLFILLIAFIISCSNSSSSNPDPDITRIQPTSGPPGTAVIISGSGFSAQVSGNEVEFNGTAATVTDASESKLTATVPNGATSGAVSVTVGQATATGPNFTVEAAAPGISAVDPDSGVVGTEVTITGMNFSATASENTIVFNGTNATVKNASETELVTEVPQGATDGPIEVTVNQKSATGPNFDVITDGTLQVITGTTGSDLDSDGYAVVLDGDNGTSIGINDTLYFNDLESESYQLELTDIANNCSLSGSNPRTEDITAGDTTSTTFQTTCSALQKEEKIVFDRRTPSGFEIFIMNPDGSNEQQLTDNSVYDGHPVISHDGTKIAFYSERINSDGDLFIMNTDGSNIQRLTTDAANDPSYYSWSPDDSQIVFRDIRDGDTEIYTINADGTGLNQLTDNTSDDNVASWSPSGNTIAFVRRYGSSNSKYNIFTIDPDGSNETQVTDDSNIYGSISYSPDGSKFAVTGRINNNSSQLYVIDTDGTNAIELTNESDCCAVSSPSWSPDGTQIVLGIRRNNTNQLYTVKADGSNTPVRISNSGSDEGRPHWGIVNQ